MNRSTIIKLIKQPLQSQNVSKVILFGPHSKGAPDESSDVDLLVITNDDYTPASFSEKMAIKIPIANPLSELRKLTDIDLIVYTKPMYQRFLEMESGLKREIDSTGSIVYEADN